jgi:phosphonate transport system substrate-binding protein
MRKPSLLAGICTLLLVLGSLLPAMAGGEPLAFGLISSAAPKTQLAAWQPFLDDMAKSLERPVEARCSAEYAGVIWAMAAGTVRIAWLGNKSAIEAVDRAGGEVALRAVDPAGHTEYFSHLLVRKGSGLTTVDDVFARAGELTFGDGDTNSTSGHVVPDYYLFAARGATPRTVFKRVVQGSHEENFLGVADGRLDVATGNSVDLDRFRKLYPQQAREIDAVWTSPPIPSDPIVWRADLPADLKDRIRKFFLDYGQPGPGKPPAQLAREKAILAAMTRSGFHNSDNTQLLAIRTIELHRERSRLASRYGQTQQDREKLAAIDDTLRRLQVEPSGTR